MPNVLRAAIVDDERAARLYLADLLVAIGDVAVVGAFEESEPALAAIRNGEPIDVVFVDVNLRQRDGDTSGLAAARAFAALPTPPQLVLATAHPEHALQGFELGALDYLVKPWTRARVEQCVSRVRERRRGEGSYPSRIAARVGRALRLIPIDEVLAFEASDRLTFVHVETGRCDVDLTLTAIGASFPERFVRVHRQWLVAREHVREIRSADGGMQLLVGSHLVAPVAHERAREVRDAILQDTLGLRR